MTSPGDLVTEALGRVRRADLQLAADHWDLGTVTTALPATTGNFGQNLLLTTTTGDYVFRGNPFVAGQLAREQYFAGVFRQRCRVTAPWPYLYQPDAALFGWPYAVMGQVPGDQIADPVLWSPLAGDDHQAIAAALGRAAAEMIMVEHPQAGQWQPASERVEPYAPDWARWVTHTIVEQAERCDGLSADDRRWIDARLVRAEAFLTSDFPAVLVHGDFSRHNATAHRSTQGWAVAGVYDLASCHYGHPAEIMTRQFCDFRDHHPPLATTFATAAVRHSPTLARSCTDPDGLAVLLLLERIGIWAWARRAGRGWWPSDLGFVDWIQRYLRPLTEVVRDVSTEVRATGPNRPGLPVPGWPSVRAT